MEALQLILTVLLLVLIVQLLPELRIEVLYFVGLVLIEAVLSRGVLLHYLVVVVGQVYQVDLFQDLEVHIHDAFFKEVSLCEFKEIRFGDQGFEVLEDLSDMIRVLVVVRELKFVLAAPARAEELQVLLEESPLVVGVFLSRVSDLH